MDKQATESHSLERKANMLYNTGHRVYLKLGAHQLFPNHCQKEGPPAYSSGNKVAVFISLT